VRFKAALLIILWVIINQIHDDPCATFTVQKMIIKNPDM